MNATGNAAVSRCEFLKKTCLQTFVFQYIAVDCTWEQWGDWSACPDKCGISTKFRAREKIEHICGGLECKGLGIEEEDCDRLYPPRIRQKSVVLHFVPSGFRSAYDFI